MTSKTTKKITVYMLSDENTAEWRVEARRGLSILGGDTFRGSLMAADNAAHTLLAFYVATRGADAVDSKIVKVIC